MVNPRRLELEIAKQILEEVFHARPSDIEEMIQSRLEEKNWRQESWQEEENMAKRVLRKGIAIEGASVQDFN